MVARISLVLWLTRQQPEILFSLAFLVRDGLFLHPPFWLILLYHQCCRLLEFRSPGPPPGFLRSCDRTTCQVVWLWQTRDCSRYNLHFGKSKQPWYCSLIIIMSRGERSFVNGNISNSMRKNYQQGVADVSSKTYIRAFSLNRSRGQYYTKVKSTYRNPHFPGIRLCLFSWLNRCLNSIFVFPTCLSGTNVVDGGKKSSTSPGTIPKF